MFVLTVSVLLIFTAVGDCEYAQVSCSYSSKEKHLERIWCKRDSDNENCCTGYWFTSTTTEFDGGQVKVADNGSAFTLSVTGLSQGEGVYWCGLKNDSNIIKLNEINMYNDSQNFIWSILRWVLFGVLMLTLVSTHIYCNNKEAQRKNNYTQH